MDDKYRNPRPLQIEGFGANSKAVGESLIGIPGLSDMIDDIVNSIFTVML